MSASLKTVKTLTAKLEWAEEHIHNLEIAWTSFLDGGAYEVIPKDDPKSGNRTYYLGNIQEIRDRIPLLVGDAVHNLRSALDHLIQHLISVHERKPRPFDDVYFPISADSSKYKSARGRIVQRVRQDAMKAIDGIEPYGGGKGEILWTLHSLDIVDKHHLLITVGSTNRFRTMPPTQRDNMVQRFLGGTGLELDRAAVTSAFLIQSQNVIFPLKSGDILCAVPKDEVEDDMHFTFEIAFGEPLVIEGKPIVRTLHQMAERISDIIYGFSNDGLLE